MCSRHCSAEAVLEVPRNDQLRHWSYWLMYGRINFLCYNQVLSISYFRYDGLNQAFDRSQSNCWFYKLCTLTD